jgi:8-oxo-dGTP diphosphatase
MDTTHHERPILTVDVALFTLLRQQLHVLLMQRDQQPFAGQLALPGGYVRVNEDVDCTMAAHRVTRDKLGIAVGYLEQLCTFSGIWRDPRGWSASVAHIAVIKPSQLSTLATQEFYSVDNLPALGFDHNEIIDVAVQRLRNKTKYSALPLFLMPSKFTINDLRLVYEKLLGSHVNRNNFRRLVLEQKIIEPTGEMEVNTAHRPAELFRAAHIQPTQEQKLAMFKDIR